MHLLHQTKRQKPYFLLMSTAEMIIWGHSELLSLKKKWNGAELKKGWKSWFRCSLSYPETDKQWRPGWKLCLDNKISRCRVYDMALKKRGGGDALFQTPDSIMGQDCFSTGIVTHSGLYLLVNSRQKTTEFWRYSRRFLRLLHSTERINKVNMGYYNLFILDIYSPKRIKIKKCFSLIKKYFLFIN